MAAIEPQSPDVFALHVRLNGTEGEVSVLRSDLAHHDKDDAAFHSKTEADHKALADRHDELEEYIRGNGQPGIIDKIWAQLNSHSKTINIGIGVVLALQFLTLILVGL